MFGTIPLDLPFHIGNTWGMTTDIPSADTVRGWLAPLDAATLRKLSDVSGVPMTTLWNIRSRSTADPRIETVRQFAPHISGLPAVAPQATTEQVT